jgi:hypothetical protein
MALDPNIALGVRGVEVANPLAQYAQVAQIQSMQNQNQVSQMQLDQMRRDEATLQQIQAKAVEHGGPADIRQIANAYLNSGNPKFIQFGIEIDQKLNDRAQIAKIMGMGQTPTAAPPPAAPTTNALAPTMQAGALGSGTFGMAPEPVNRLAPAPAAPAPAPAANALAAPAAAPAATAPGGLDVNTLFAQQNAFIAMGKPEMARALDARIALASRQQPEIIREMQAFGIPITPEGFKQYTTLKQTTPQIKEIGVAMGTNRPVYFDTRTDQQFTVGIDPASNKQIRLPYVGGVDRSTSNVKVSATATTEKKYGEQLAGKIADSDSNKLGAAEKAPQLAESANRIIDLVSQGNLFTGPIADVKLNIARALNVVGASNDEKIANTEALIAATGQSTLDAIKGAGLGTGQGFTDKDLKFLQGIAGGAITYTPQTLTQLATLQHRVATRSVENWNRRFKEIPKSATEGLGIQAAPDVAPLSSGAKAAAAPRPAGVGANWTFENDAAGNKAWVSPDRKSFKEVQ